MTASALAVTILGSGTSTGVPVAGCACRICRSADPRDARTRCSALLSWNGSNILIDTSTDFRQQVLREGIDRIDAVLYTHTHADHLHGIDDLRPFNLAIEGAIPIYAAGRDLRVIRRTFPYIFAESAEPTYRPSLELREISGPFELFGRRVQPVPLQHGKGLAQGYRVGSFAYLTDCSAVPASSLELLAGLELLVVDALRFSPHATHFNISQALDLVRLLAPRRALLTHLSHEVEHAVVSTQLPEGVELAYDGLRIDLGHES